MIPSRQETQEKLGRLSAATLQHKPSQAYSVGDRLEERAAAHPERPFLRFEGRTLSYAEIDAAANRMAHAGHALGLGHGDRVGLLMENRPEFLTSWLGLAKLGVTTVLLNSQVRGRVLAHAVEAGGARHLIVGSECLAALDELPARLREEHVWHLRRDSDAATPGNLPQGIQALGIQDLDARLAAAPASPADPAWREGLVAGDDLFHIFTSGTTGLPKAARLSHMRFLGVGDGMSAVAGYGPEEVIACVLPLYHGAGGMVVISCALSQGACVALRRRFSASRFWEEVRRDGVTACQYIGEICRYLLARPPRPDDREHGLRILMGAGLGPDIWAAFQERFGIERILEGWSSTEANTSLINLDGVVGSCGRIPFPELHNGRLIRYEIETDSHARNEAGFCIECDAGEVGEFIGAIPDLPDFGGGRFEGYTDAAATEAKVLRGVFAEGDAWYRSGDLLCHDEEGYYRFVDRIGDTYRWKSENVSTQEVAEALSGFPGLELANVYGVRVPGHEGRAGMAALVLSHPERFSGEAFYAWVDARLPRYAAPLFVRLTPRADVTSTFKLRKVDLQREGYDPERAADPFFVRDDEVRDYRSLGPESLARAGLPPFEASD